MKLIDVSGYKLVYQGGHHDVYCNGSVHVRTGGGWTQNPIDKAKVIIMDNCEFKCDCNRWGNK